VAVLVDVHPNGRMLNLGEGAVWARHVRPNPPAVAGAIYHFGIDPAAASVLLASVHQIALHISSSSFPAIELDPSTGNAVRRQHVDDLRAARQTIHRDHAHPSWVVLAVVPRSDSDWIELPGA
jgi:hypothetical protein